MFFVPLQGKRLKLTFMTRKEAQKAILKWVDEEIKNMVKMLFSVPPLNVARTLGLIRSSRRR